MNKEVLKIIFILPNLRSGGAERVSVTIANMLLKYNYEVSMILMNDNDMFFKSQLNHKIAIELLNFDSLRDFFIHPFRFYNKLKQINPSIIFCGYGELNSLVVIYSLFFKRKKFIARETSIPSIRITNKFVILLYKYFYRLFDLVIVQSDAMYSDLFNNFKIKKEKLKKIYNPLDFEFIDNKLTKNRIKSKSYNENQIILTFIGTITKQKNIDLAISFFEKLKGKGVNCILRIVGSGPYDNVINSLIKKSLYNTYIIKENFTTNPYRYLENSDYLLICSDYEGYPNIGIEANCCGTPILLSDKTLGGAKELVVPGLNGEIISFENPDMNFLNIDFDSSQIREFIFNRHSVKKIIEDYLLVMNSIVR